jgi:protein phosphatase 1L
VVSIQGLRSYQEDKYVAKLSFRKDPQCAFFGVFDGHGGARASEYLSKNLHEVLLREPALTDDPETALKSAFLQVRSGPLPLVSVGVSVCLSPLSSRVLLHG